MAGILVLVRHGQSEWNLKNLFTGWTDVGLTEQGIAEARTAGGLLKAKGLVFDIAYTSALSRAQDTLTLMLEELGQKGLETVRDEALNERDYGDLTGLNKDDARKRWGEEQVHIWRRKPEGYLGAGTSLLRGAHPARRAHRQARPRLRPWQFAPCADHDPRRP